VSPILTTPAAGRQGPAAAGAPTLTGTDSWTAIGRLQAAQDISNHSISSEIPRVSKPTVDNSRLTAVQSFREPSTESRCGLATKAHLDRFWPHARQRNRVTDRTLYHQSPIVMKTILRHRIATLTSADVRLTTRCWLGAEKQTWGLFVKRSVLLIVLFLTLVAIHSGAAPSYAQAADVTGNWSGTTRVTPPCGQRCDAVNNITFRFNQQGDTIM
jgi:hypothetical protein